MERELIVTLVNTLEVLRDDFEVALKEGCSERQAMIEDKSIETQDKLYELLEQEVVETIVELVNVYQDPRGILEENY